MESTVFEWKDVTDSFPEERRHWQGLYLEICEAAIDEIECSLFSNPAGDWEIFFCYGIIHGVSYASAGEARGKRESMKAEIEQEYKKNGAEPSDEFINSFGRKYKADVLHSYC